MTPPDLTKPVQTRDGRPVRILCTDAPGPFPVVGLINGEDLTGFRWTPSGRSNYGPHESPEDLANVPERFSFTRWVNVYQGFIGDGVYETRRQADTYGTDGRTACIEVTISGQVGDGLEGK
jgi:hypothetical protein